MSAVDSNDFESLSPLSSLAGGYALFLVEQGYTPFRIFEAADCWTAVHRLAYHWTLLFGVVGDRAGYSDNFCYQTYERAVEALYEWDPSQGGEPEGWHRNPRTGRRRPGGDEAQEYIAW